MLEGAEPGDVLEVKIQSIDLAIDYGYNGCKGYCRKIASRTRRCASSHSTATG